MSIEILKVNNLSKYYGDIRGVENVSFSLNEGEIFGFIGPNGAGKSTTIRRIMNLINKNEGKVYVYGKEFKKQDSEIKSLIGYLPSEINLYDDLTVKQILDYHASFYKKDVRARKEELVNRLQLDVTKRIEELSLGNLKKLGIVLAFMHEPKLLILDEPISGLDPLMQEDFYRLLKEEKARGTAIIYSTHILSEISKICDRVGIIKDGNLLKVETIATLTKKQLNLVTIQSKNIEKIVKEMKLKPEYIDDNTIKFKNALTPNKLMESLSNYKIDRLLIEEATLEEVFLHYYK